MIEILTRCAGCKRLVSPEQIGVPANHPCTPEGTAHQVPAAVTTAIETLQAADKPELSLGVFIAPSGHYAPFLSEQDKAFLHESKSLTEHLFDLADVFCIPMTNNMPWFEDRDLTKPVFEVGEFIGAVLDAIKAHPDDVRALLTPEPQPDPVPDPVPEPVPEPVPDPAQND